MNTMLLLVRREFWEHRSLWLAPLVWVGLIIVMSMWGTILTFTHDAPFSVGHYASVEAIPHLGTEERARLSQAMTLSEDRKATMHAVAQFAIAGMISALVLIVVFFYLIDCLYAERRDRSILLWKSMPISDAQVVLSKVAVALLIMPLGVLLLAAVTHVIVSGIFWIRFDGTVLGKIVGGWSFEGWFRALWASLLITVGGVLWYVPVAGYLLLVSVWAHRAVFLWAVLPPAALMLLEKMFLHSEHVAEFVGRRLMGFVEEMDLRSGSFTHSPGDVQMPTIGEAYDAFSISGLFTHPELWVGLLAGAVLIAVTIRIRRYRDDS